jgi:hypothetical protein
MEQKAQYKKVYTHNFTNEEKKELLKRTGTIGQRKGTLKQ